MLSEQIRGIANYIVVGLLIDNKIIRLLYPIADEVDKLGDYLEHVDGERVQFGDRVAYLEERLMNVEGENGILRAMLIALGPDGQAIEREIEKRKIKDE